tara:strand:- start:678 stop:1310 length:633 start_codon:yes stop_codon:yes gene_type:complete
MEKEQLKFKTMIKTKVIKSLSTIKGEFTRQDIQKAIWVAQGNPIETYVSRQGYYAMNIREWNSEDLITNIRRGVFKIGKDANIYLTNKKQWRANRKKKAIANRKRVEERREKFNALPKHMQWKTSMCADLNPQNDYCQFGYLNGKTIKEVRRLTQEEMNSLGWHSNPLVIIFTDGTCIIPQRDDEGNDGGAMMFFDLHHKSSQEDIIFVR